MDTFICPVTVLVQEGFYSSINNLYLISLSVIITARYLQQDDWLEQSVLTLLVCFQKGKNVWNT